MSDNEANPASRATGASAGTASPSEDDLSAIAKECSDNERRAAEAERELMEWKKVKFMQHRIGEDFDAMVMNVTKYGLFVELTDLFIEGLVPLGSLLDDIYTYRENTRQIIGNHSGRRYSIGDRLRVILDRVDEVERRLQFSVLDEPQTTSTPRPARRSRNPPQRPSLHKRRGRKSAASSGVSRKAKANADSRRSVQIGRRLDSTTLPTDHTTAPHASTFSPMIISGISSLYSKVRDITPPVSQCTTCQPGKQNDLRQPAHGGHMVEGRHARDHVEDQAGNTKQRGYLHPCL